MSKRKGLSRTHNSTIIHPLTSEERKVGWGEEVDLEAAAALVEPDPEPAFRVAKA